MAPRPLHPAMAPWCHVQSAKVVRRPHPLLEVRTPIAIAIWGKTGVVDSDYIKSRSLRELVFETKYPSSGQKRVMNYMFE